MRLTDYFIKKRVRSLASGAAGRKHTFRTLKDANRILVLYQEGDEAELEPYLESLRKRGKMVETCVYICGSSKEEPAVGLPVYAAKDIDIWWIPSANIVRQFKAIEADILIDLTHSGCYPMQYLMLQHPCEFKVGIKQANIDLHDLSISVTAREDIGHLFEHILFYLQEIRSK